MTSLLESQQQDLNNTSNNNGRKATARCKIDLNDYLNPLYLILLSPILKSLQNGEIKSEDEKIQNFHNLKFNNNNNERTLLNERILASIIFYYKKFMEDFCGKDSPKPRDLVKLPNSVFKNFSVYGPLHLFFVEILNQVILPKGISCYETVFSDKSSQLIESLKQIETLLIEESFIKRPVMFFNKVPFKLINKLFKIVTDHGGEIVNSEELATHIIEYNEEIDNIPEELKEDFIRITEKKSDMYNIEKELVLIHWWYHPDSYDEWIPTTDIDSLDPPDIVFPSVKKEQWRVCCRFITDCELYNEWCNEIDYENEALYADEEEPINSESTTLALKKRGRKKYSLVTSTVKEFPIPEAISITSKMMADICPVSIKQELVNNNNSEESKWNIVDMEPFLPSAENDEKDKMIVDGENNNSVANNNNKRKLENVEIDNSFSNESTKNSFIKSNTNKPDWLMEESISEYEIIHIGEKIINNRINYIKIRNSIINLYKSNPNIYLSGTDCRRNISGDANFIIKIYEFLNSFGLINYSINSDSRPFHEIQTLLSFTSSDNNNNNNNKSNIKNNNKFNNNNLWTKELDKLLIESVKVYNEDWERISLSLDVVEITASECLMRFIELSIDVKDNISYNDNSIFDHFNSFKQSFKSILDEKLRKDDPYKIIKNSFENIDNNDKKKLKFEINNIINSYLDARLEAFDHKIRLLDSVEKLLEIDRESIEVDRKDLQIKMAQLSSLQQQQNSK